VLGVYLGLPVERPGLPTARMGGEGRAVQTRYSREFTNIPDMVTGEGEREIAYAKKELQILFSTDDLNEYDCLRIAEVVRNPDGVMELRKSYVPSATAIGASGYLKDWVKGLLEQCSAKSDALAEKVRQRTPQMADFTGSDMPNFLLLHTINSAIPALAHFYNHPQAHPVEVFGVMARLAGALCTFSNEMKANDLPVYNHNDLSGCFIELERRLRGLLEMVVQARYVKIPLTQKQPTLFEGAIANPEILASGQFYVGVAADIPENKLITEFPLHGKIISPDKIELLIQKNLPGVGLVYVAHPPAALPVKAGMSYFRLENKGDRWDFICQANAVSIDGPPALFPSLMVELMAVEG
jgi:type VI secretion system protein ImpJ